MNPTNPSVAYGQQVDTYGMGDEYKSVGMIEQPSKEDGSFNFNQTTNMTAPETRQMVATTHEDVDSKSRTISSDSNQIDDHLAPSASEMNMKKASSSSNSKAGKRRNIRSVMDSKDLNRATLMAIYEEQRRLTRIGEQTLAIGAPNNSQNKDEFMDDFEALVDVASSSETEGEIDDAGIDDEMLDTKMEGGDMSLDGFAKSWDQDDFKSLPSGLSLANKDEDIICVEDESSDEEGDSNLGGDFVDESGHVIINPKRPKNESDILVAEHLVPVLKPHQISGIRFLWENLVESLQRYKSLSSGMGCILAHSMGLGKTLQTIAFIEAFLRETPAARVLALVPVNVLENWLREFDVWLPTATGDSKFYDRPFSVFCLNDNSKSKRERAETITEWLRMGGVMIMGYECFCVMSAIRSPDAFKPGGGSGGTSNAGRPSRKRRQNAQISAVVDEVIGRVESSSDLQCEVIDIEMEEMLEALVTDLRRALVDPGPDLIVCDEGHRIRNMKTKTSLVLSTIRTRRRLILTGYPLQNNLREYWCMVNFVRPNLLGTKAEFCNMFERPIINGQCIDSTVSDKRLMRQRTHVLTRMLRGFVQRRSHALLKDILPPKYEFVLYCKKTPVQAQLYSAFMQYCKNELDPDDSKMNPLRAFAVCCKIWNHPDILFNLLKHLAPSSDSRSRSGFSAPLSGAYPDSIDFQDLGLSRQSSSDDSQKSVAYSSLDYYWADPAFQNYVPGLLDNSAKFVLTFDIIRESVAAGDKILIFSQSLFALNTLELFLNETSIPGEPAYWRKNVSYVRLDGAVGCSDRDRLIDRFNTDPQMRIFLISTRAGSLGINLVGANRVIVMDASWNPCHDAQAVCRVYRYGQHKPCFIYRLITDNSMEMVIFRRQINKQGISENVVDQRTVSTQVTNRELSSLLEYDPEKDRVSLESAIEPSDLSALECDSALFRVCNENRGLLSQKPLFHESLILDLRNQRLSKEEKKEARLQYRQELRQLRGGYAASSYLASSRFMPPDNARGSSSAPPVDSLFTSSKNLVNDASMAPPGSATPIPGSIVPRQRRDPSRYHASASSVMSSENFESKQNRRRNCTVTKIFLPYAMQLPSVTFPGVSIALSAGTPGYLVNTADGVYFRGKDRHVYDVTRTPLANPDCAAIKMQRSVQKRQYVSDSEQKFDDNGGFCPTSNSGPSSDRAIDLTATSGADTYLPGPSGCSSNVRNSHSLAAHQAANAENPDLEVIAITDTGPARPTTLPPTPPQFLPPPRPFDLLARPDNHQGYSGPTTSNEQQAQHFTGRFAPYQSMRIPQFPSNMQAFQNNAYSARQQLPVMGNYDGSSFPHPAGISSGSIVPSTSAMLASDFGNYFRRSGDSSPQLGGIVAHNHNQGPLITPPLYGSPRQMGLVRASNPGQPEQNMDSHPMDPSPNSQLQQNRILGQQQQAMALRPPVGHVAPHSTAVFEPVRDFYAYSNAYHSQ